MLPTSFIYTILATSITGASLILLVYSVIYSRSKSILLKNAQSYFSQFDNLFNLLDSFRSKSGNIKNLSEEQRETIHKLTGDLKEFTGIPYYLTRAAGYGVFGSFMISALMAIFWVTDFNKTFMDDNIVMVFGLGVILFFLVGIVLINDITTTVSEDFNEIMGSNIDKRERKIERRSMKK